MCHFFYFASLNGELWNLFYVFFFFKDPCAGFNCAEIDTLVWRMRSKLYISGQIFYLEISLFAGSVGKLVLFGNVEEGFFFNIFIFRELNFFVEVKNSFFFEFKGVWNAVENWRGNRECFCSFFMLQDIFFPVYNDHGREFCLYSTIGNNKIYLFFLLALIEHQHIANINIK